MSMPGQGDRAAFIERCYELYEQKTFRVAFAVLKDEGLAEDAVQEAFLKLMKSGTYFDDPACTDCKYYVFSVVKNAAVDLYRKRAREKSRCVDAETEVLEAVPDVSGGEGLYERTVEAVGRLPERYRSVAERAVRGGMPIGRIACDLGISEAAARKRWERAKKMLRKELS